jgi:protein-S-isoprenylcysteine O-methyltransferase Ste14
VTRQADSSADRYSVRQLTAQLGRQLAQLLHDELALARAEAFARARQATTGGVLVTAAALLGMTSWLAVVAAGIAGIATVLPVWASALIVAAFLMLAAAALALWGRRRLRTVPPLTLTAQSVRSDVAEVRARTGPLRTGHH